MTRAVPTSPPEAWIVNASPFIGLAKVGQLGLLMAPGRQVYLPQVVAQEIRSQAHADAAAEAVGLVLLGGLEITLLPASPIDPRVLAVGWSRGEDGRPRDLGEQAVLTEVLAHPGSVAVIDDDKGRMAARRLGLRPPRLTGSLGVLINAKLGGRLAAVAPVVKDLRAIGIRLPDDAFLRNLLVPLGEAWP